MEKKLFRPKFTQETGNPQQDEIQASEEKQPEQHEEDHVGMLNMVKERLDGKPGTEGIIRAIDSFLNDDGNYEEAEKKEDKIFGGFAQYFAKKNQK